MNRRSVTAASQPKRRLDQLTLPVVCFHAEWAALYHNWNDLTTTTKTGIRKGEFNDLLIVDRLGRALRVRGLERSHWTGRLFLKPPLTFSRKIRVEPRFEGEPFQLGLEELRRRVLESFQQWHGWTSASDFAERQERVVKAKSIEEIFEAFE